VRPRRRDSGGLIQATRWRKHATGDEVNAS
jgi:hypothetical protein